METWKDEDGWSVVYQVAVSGLFCIFFLREILVRFLFTACFSSYWIFLCICSSITLWECLCLSRLFHPQVLRGVIRLSRLVLVGCREWCAGEGECGHAVSYCQSCTWAFIHWIPLSFSPTYMPSFPFPLPPCSPSRPPHSLEAVRHKAVNHWIQAAI